MPGSEHLREKMNTGRPVESEENERLMRLIDQQYSETPFFGSWRMARLAARPTRKWPRTTNRTARPQVRNFLLRARNGCFRAACV